MVLASVFVKFSAIIVSEPVDSIIISVPNKLVSIFIEAIREIEIVVTSTFIKYLFRFL